jgi:type VI secretion system secreted protein VgrG
MHQIVIAGVTEGLRVVRFHGWEGLSSPFSFVVTVMASLDRPLALDEAVGKPSTLRIEAADGEVRSVHGVIEQAEVGEEGAKHRAYRVRLVPTASRLGQRHDLRIFQDKSVPAVVKEVLEAAGVEHRFQLSGAYEAREYCVQYRESDWDFVQRLLEEEGIHTYFDHTGSADVLVVADSSAAHAPIEGESTLVFRPPTGALVKQEHVSAFRWADERRSGKTTLRDYDFKKPKLVLESSRVAGIDDDLERYDYPGRYTTQPVGTARARMASESLESGRHTGAGASACGRFVPGFTFRLSEHPVDELNQEYLLVRVEHRGSEPELEAGATVPYENDFEVVRANLAYRPPRVTPKPMVNGIQTAFVVGPAGDEIHTDEHGRIKVQFHWDRKGKLDDKSSCWLRVAQAWAGPGFGAMFLPRVGHEVVVSFVDGDPDRPLATGSVYHGQNVPPYALPAHKTRSTLKTQSTPGGGGFNELRFEDKKGSEEVYLRAEKDWNTLVQNDRTQQVGHDESLTVGNDRTLDVGANETETIGDTRSIQVGKHHVENIGQNMDLTVGNHFTHQVGKAFSLAVGDISTTKVTKDATLSVGGSATTTITKSAVEDVGTEKSVQVGGAYALAVKKDAAIQVDGNETVKIAKKQTVTVGDTYSLTVGSGTITVKKNGDIVIKGKNVTVEGSGPIKVKGSKLEVESQGAVNVKASGAVKVQGGSVNMN